MLSPLENYFSKFDLETLSCLEFLRKYILKLDSTIMEEWKYGMPFYYIKNKIFCYLWVHKKMKQPYIGIVEGQKIIHEELIQENRKRIKILLIDQTKDIPLEKIDLIMHKVLRFYK